MNLELNGRNNKTGVSVPAGHADKKISLRSTYYQRGYLPTVHTSTYIVRTCWEYESCDEPHELLDVLYIDIITLAQVIVPDSTNSSTVRTVVRYTISVLLYVL